MVYIIVQPIDVNYPLQIIYLIFLNKFSMATEILHFCSYLRYFCAVYVTVFDCSGKAKRKKEINREDRETGCGETNFIHGLLVLKKRF